MVDTAVKSPCFEAINTYIQRHSDDGIAQDRITTEDWEVLRSINDFLTKLADTTLALEFDYARFCDCHGFHSRRIRKGKRAIQTQQDISNYGQFWLGEALKVL